MNKERENKIYNESLKEKYLSTLSDDTAKIYRYAFYRSFDTEDIAEKDLCTFNTEEIIDALKNGNHTTISSLKYTFNVFSSYISWAASNGLRNSNISSIDTIKMDELRSYLDKSKKLYLSKEELEELEGKLVNYQDKVVARLLFEGVSGHELSEVLNLQKHHVLENNTLLLIDDKKGERNLQVSPECIDIIKGALREDKYVQKNGTSNSNASEVPLVENDYVVKSAARKTVNPDRADRHLIYRRLSMMSELFDYPYLTAKNLEKSGMIFKAVELYEDHKKLDKEEFAIIGDKFAVKKHKIDEYEYYNTTVFKEFINRENILELYSIDIEVSN